MTEASRRLVSPQTEESPRNPDLWLRIAAVAVEVVSLKRELGARGGRVCRRGLAAGGLVTRGSGGPGRGAGVRSCYQFCA